MSLGEKFHDRIKRGLLIKIEAQKYKREEHSALDIMFNLFCDLYLESIKL